MTPFYPINHAPSGAAFKEKIVIYTAEQTAAIFSAIQSIELGNNGYADIGTDSVIAEAVEKAGYVVIKNGKTYKGFTKAAQAALAVEPFGISRYSDTNHNSIIEIDYEGALLARAERMTELY